MRTDQFCELLQRLKLASRPMSTDQFRELLQRLKLAPSGQRTADALGLSVRQLQRIVSGKSPVPRPVALLAVAYTKLSGGVPDPLWDLNEESRNPMQEPTQV